MRVKRMKVAKKNNKTEYKTWSNHVRETIKKDPNLAIHYLISSYRDGHVGILMRAFNDVIAVYGDAPVEKKRQEKENAEYDKRRKKKG